MPPAKRTKAVDALLRGALAAARGDAELLLAGKRILVVDDRARELARVLATLHRVGGDDLEISTARTAGAAIDICRSHGGRFDVVLLKDLLDPAGDSGLDLLGHLWRAGLPSGATTVLYSGAMTGDLRRQAMAAGFAEALHADDIDTATLEMTFVRLLAPASRRKRTG